MKFVYLFLAFSYTSEANRITREDGDITGEVHSPNISLGEDSDSGSLTVTPTKSETLAINVTNLSLESESAQSSNATTISNVTPAISDASTSKVTTAASVTSVQSESRTSTETAVSISTKTEGPRPFGLNTENTEDTDDVYDEEGLTDLAIESSNEKTEAEKPNMEPVEKKEPKNKTFSGLLLVILLCVSVYASFYGLSVWRRRREAASQQQYLHSANFNNPVSFPHMDYNDDPL